jgi:hypothetical protein
LRNLSAAFQSFFSKGSSVWFLFSFSIRAIDQSPVQTDYRK